MGLENPARTKKRVLILLLLAAGTLVHRGPGMNQTFSGSNIELRAGFTHKVEGSHLTVATLKEKDSSGQPTPAFVAGLKVDDRIMSVYNQRGEGSAIKGLFDYGAIIRRIRPVEPWTLVVQRDSDGAKAQQLRLSMPPVSSSHVSVSTRILAIGLAIILPLLAIIMAFFIGFMKPEDDNAFLAIFSS